MHLYVGPIVHSIKFGTLEFGKSVAIGISTSGLIEFVKPHAEPLEGATAESLKQLYGPAITDITIAPPNSFLIPGLIDTHTHAPQMVNAGLGLDMPLLDWLETYTFPREAEFADVQVADRVYPSTVRRHLLNGTTTACYYGTIHLESNKRLVDIIASFGQRAFVGKVNMDRNCPPALMESAAQSLEDTRSFVSYCDGFELIQPVITPRFAPSCSSPLLRGLGDIAAQGDLLIQSHLGENKQEISWVADLFPQSESYAHVYDDHGLLTARTIMAHCIHLRGVEMDLLRDRRVGVSHCACSNFGLSSGVCSVRKLLRHGVKVGLGSDVSGGYNSSMIDTIRQSIVASKVLYMNNGNDSGGNEDFKPLTVAEAFHLATMGSAELVGMEESLGNFLVGKSFDAVLVSLEQFSGGSGVDGHLRAAMDASAHSNSNIELWPHDSLETSFERFIYLGDDRNVSSVWVQGRKVVSKTSSFS
eukprot:Partr_v1_DN28281_c0_g1_i2_m75942 putative Guanine deaminase